MKKLAVCLVFSAAAVLADTAETVFFRAVMLPANEVPATNFNGSAVATIGVHVVRNDANQIVSGSVDFTVKVSSGAAATATGLHIHSGAAGQNGPVLISSGLSAGDNMPLTVGTQTISRQGQVQESDNAGLNAMRDLLVHPDQYYVNIHTTDLPAGAARGQLLPTQAVVLMGFMDAANE